MVYAQTFGVGKGAGKGEKKKRQRGAQNPQAQRIQGLHVLLSYRPSLVLLSLFI